MRCGFKFAASRYKYDNVPAWPHIRRPRHFQICGQPLHMMPGPCRMSSCPCDATPGPSAMASAMMLALLLRRALVELGLEESLKQPSTFLPCLSQVYWRAPSDHRHSCAAPLLPMLALVDLRLGLEGGPNPSEQRVPRHSVPLCSAYSSTAALVCADDALDSTPSMVHATQEPCPT